MTVEIGLLKAFDVVWPFIFVLAAVGALLASTLFKKAPAIGWVVAAVLAVLSVLSPIAKKTINLMAPWFILILLFSIFLLLAFMLFGIKEETIVDILTNKTPGKWGTVFSTWIFVVGAIIFLGSLATVLSEETGRIIPKTGFWDTLTHPTLLGAAVLLLIAVFTVLKLGERPE